MRRILVTVAVVAVLLLGAPYLMGMMAQKQVNKMVTKVNQENPSVKLNITSYERGWTSSVAHIEMVPALPQLRKAAGDFKLKLKEKISHGPVIFSDTGPKLGMAYIKSKLSLSPEMEKDLNDFFKDQSKKPKIISRWLIGLTGNTVHKAKIPAFDFKLKEKAAEFSWKGLVTSAKISSNIDAITGRTEFGGFSLSLRGFDLQVANITVDLDTHEAIPGLWVGDVVFALPRLSVKMLGKDRLLLTDLKMATNTSLQGELFAGNLAASMGRLQVDSMSYGPMIFALSMKNFDAKSLVEIEKRLQSIRLASTTEQQRNIGLSIVPLLPALLDKGAELSVDKLQARIPEGDITANGFARINKAGKDDQPLPQGLQTRLEVELKLRVPQALMKRLLATQSMKNVEALRARQRAALEAHQKQLAAQQQAQAEAASAAPSPAPRVLSDEQAQQVANLQAQQQIDALIKQGYLVAQGNDYSVSLSFHKGKVTVNGKNIPLPF